MSRSLALSGGFAAVGSSLTTFAGACSGVVGGVAAFCATPTFTGWAGVGKSVLVGASTSFGFYVAATGGALAGAVAGGLLGSFNKSAGRTAAVLGTAGALVSGVWGGLQGYDVSKGWMTAGDNCAPTTKTSAADIPNELTVPGTAMKYDRVANTLTIPSL